MLAENKRPSHEPDGLSIQTSEFIELFEAERKRLYAYIYAYVMDKTVADDIFQETSMILWREFEKFELGSSFTKWSNGIVFNRIRVYRRENKKHSLCLSDELLQEISSNLDYETSSENKWNALQFCRAQLSLPDQRLYEYFYVKNLDAQSIADKSGRSIFAIRKSVHKLRKKLFDCVDRKKAEGWI